MAHIADTPEKLLIAAAAPNVSPTSLHKQKDFGSSKPAAPRTRKVVKRLLSRAKEAADPVDDVACYVPYAKSIGLNGVHRPYWLAFKSLEPYRILSPDLLHQVLKFFQDHVFHWVLKTVGKRLLDWRIKVLQRAVGIRHFSKGVSTISQWTGGETKELIRRIVPVAAGGGLMTPRAIVNLRSCVDLVFLAHYESHSELTLEYLREAFTRFHKTKKEWIRLRARVGKTKDLSRFEIPKLSSWHELVPSIRELGALPQLSSGVTTEPAHKGQAKFPWRRTNKRADYLNQMCRDLDCTERVRRHDHYVDWRRLSPGMETDGDLFDATTPAQEEMRPLDPKYPARSIMVTPSIRLSKRPSTSSIRLAAVAEAYRLPDLRAALSDFLSGVAHHPRHLRVASDDVILAKEFDHLDVWEQLRLSVVAVQDSKMELPPRMIKAVPPQNDLPYGWCNTVLVKGWSGKRHDDDAEGLSGIPAKSSCLTSTD